MIKIKGLRKTYHLGGSDVHALDGVTLEIADGDFVAVTGPSGSGKSTLMQVLGLLDDADSGSYELFGQPMQGSGPDALAEERSQRIGFVFQQFNLLNRTSAVENVRLPALYHPAPPPPQKALELLDLVGLGSRIDHNQLSGGQQQRVAIARALYNDPVLLFADEPTGNLDSRSTVEILKLLQSLNARGITIVMVTHEPEVAAQARRCIVMRDGKVVQDKRQKALPHRALAAERPLAASRSPTWRDATVYLRQAFRSLLANKVRSALSMLGILMGVAALIAVQAIGDGAQKTMQAQLKSFGTNLLLVFPGAVSRAGVAQATGANSRAKFAQGDLEPLMAAVPSLTQVSGEVSGRVQATSNDKNWGTTVFGTSVEYVSMQDSLPPLGRWFTEQERVARERVAVVGVTVARNLWGEANPVGQTLRLNRIAFDVIGVLPAKGMNGFQDQDDRVLVPNATAQYRLLGKEFFDAVVLEVDDAQHIPDAQAQAAAFFRVRYRIPATQDDTFNIRGMSDRLAAAAAAAATTAMILKIVAGISLLVGGIGIMNIMLVTVTERTREIGLRKALGAKRRDILSQFLIESLAISLSGGAIGFVLGAGLSLGIGAFLGWPIFISVSSVLLAIGFSSLVGLIFGLWPAQKAAQLSPITALRSE